MSARRKLMVVLGTRPEAIKLAPVILGAKDRADTFETVVITTGQHKEMLAQMLDEFGITPDKDLQIMKPDQTLAHITTAALEGLSDAITAHQPDWVVVQGDTTTTFAGALAAFYQKVKVAHVEAGLRTYDKHQPYPEEINRTLTGHLADIHFPPTTMSRDNLLRENIPADRIFVTGNTAIDALFLTLKKMGRTPNKAGPVRPRERILLTAHRRENQGPNLEQICDAVLTLVDRYPSLQVTYPVHLSPRVRATVMPKLGDHPRITLTDPLGYPEFVQAMDDADIILTDSGGVQEEAPSLGKPVLVLRESTERPEASEAGTARIVGADRDVIVRETARLVDDDQAYAAMARADNPYGDGTAAAQILDRLAG